MDEVTTSRLSNDDAAALADRLRTATPLALRERKQWLLWRLEPGEKKPKKMPYYVGGGRRTGEQGSDTDRDKLATFDVVIAAVQTVRCSGVGFAFLPGDGLIGIDIDGQLGDDGAPNARTAAIIESCASYVEYSPSRRGVHIIVAGESETFKSNDIGLEVFCGRQFFTVTGEHFPGAQQQVAAISPNVLSRLKATVSQAKKATSSPAIAAPPSDKRSEIESALAALSPDCGYDDWIQIGMAVHAELGEGGWPVWNYWSSRSAKYPGDKDLLSHWKSFGGKAGVTGATIFKLARNAGWRPPRKKSLARNEPLAQQHSEIEAEAPPAHEDLISRDDRRLRRNDQGGLRNSSANVDLILRCDPAWNRVLAYDEFSYRIMKLRTPPFDGGRAGPWEETDATKAAIWIERNWGITPKSSIVDEIARSVAWDARYHAVRVWLRGLPAWDKVSRLSNFMADAFGAAQSEYTAHVGTGLVVTAVARVARPGCKVDTMIVLEGGQGIGKSTALIELFSPSWYVDIIEPPSHKDFYITLQGALVVEIGEMQSFTRSEVNQVKQAITRRDDKFRAPYDKAASDHPRQSIFVGTTNADTYLMDPSGGRRFLPVKCTHAHVEYVRAMREQLFAEALVLYRAGFRWWDFPQEQAQTEQDQRYVEDSWVEPIESWLGGESAPSKYPEGVGMRPASATTTQIMVYALGIEMAKHTRQDQMRVGQIMRRLDWKQAPLQRVPGSLHTRIRPWVRPLGDAVDKPPDRAEVPF